MQNFDFLLKTKLFFGENRENEIADILSSYSIKRIVILIGKSSVRRSGLLDKVLSKLKETNIQYLLLEGIRPNPEMDFVYKHLDEVKAFEPELVLAIGGGSVIDTAKSFAHAYYYDGDAFDFNLHKVKETKALPIGVILTISASGSEMSSSCVMQKDDSHTKSGFNSETNRPLFAICNPLLTFSVNKVQTAYGIVDILMHTIERYFNPSSRYDLSDAFSEGLIRKVLEAGLVAYNNPNDIDSRSLLMLASSFSHNGITSVGKPYTMYVHQLEHVLSGVYKDLAHAAGLAILFPKWARFYLEYDLDKFDLLAKNVFHSFKDDKYQNGLYAIECLENYFKQLNMPSTLQDVGIENVDTNYLADKFSNNGTRVVAHYKKPLDRDVAFQIYEACIKEVIG